MTTIPHPSDVILFILTPNYLHTSATFPKGKAYAWVRTFYAFPCGGRGTALAVDEEKVYGKLAIFKLE